ncbi:translation initiation factor IF-2 [Sphingomonas sp. SUN039]|uniref:translation initiation factor IF-2 n=1 Tax=Sphingomonas sp. SUN039 TaxID=2937787 RepID=UPI002164639C|nr:translation initiation factor IF-2 [Sphingomonas sp. SUN039]UVO55508.1 translation initiation factor IF-2 [Sphingomonas sp. SUN039]
MSETEKPKLGMRAPLGIKRTVETGQVKQSFSHGRSNTVVVEVKKRRFVRPGEEVPAPEPVVEVAPAPVAAPVVAPKPVAPPAAPRALTPLERREQQERLLREAEEARMSALEEARRRDDRAKIDTTEDEKRRVEENRKAEEEARIAAEEAAAEALRNPPPQPEPEVQAAQERDGDAGRVVKPTPAGALRRPEPARPTARPRGGDDRRQAGKLTVTRALEGNEEGARARSLAALKRAREKERRAHGSGQPQAKQIRDVVIPETITVGELANRMAERGNDLIRALFKMGVPSAMGDTIDQDTAELLVTEFGHNYTRVSESDVEIDVAMDVDDEATLKTRPPVVTIMGHVDHGKTSLLDALRGTDVVRGEAGGITQHIGAYQVTLKSGEQITFLDTPGHEAFGEMRKRGANVTDIVVLVVAADDSIKPQTIEAITHAKAADVPIVVAITKIDKPEANAQKVREALLQYEVIVEEMSGDVQDVEVSALKKTGLDELTEKLHLQAELLELKANPDRAAEGSVIEAKLDKGRGPLATILVRRGTLRVGDIVVVGQFSGKVRAMIDDKGRQLKEAGPSMPVEILGLSGVPSAGDPMSVVENEARAREVALYRLKTATEQRTVSAPVDIENVFANFGAVKAMEYPIVVKADTQGSVEAIVGAVNRISTDDIKVRILSSGVGGITESDVMTAAASGAPVIGFNVRPNPKAAALAKRDRVEFQYFDVIYHLTDQVRNAMAGQLGPEIIEHVVGRAEIRQVFPAGKTGKAAGLLVTEGVIKKDLRARITRDDVIIYNGKVNSLRRFKDDVAEVKAGLECGVTFDATNDIKAGDFLETFEVEERARTL